MLDLGIVILNWNTRELLRRCLQTVLASEGMANVRIVVVDNASTDGSVAMLRSEFPRVELIANAVNSGYPAGNNIGLRALGYGDAGRVQPDAPRYAMLLNPDTEVPPDALARLVAYMDARKEIGIAGPRLVLPDGRSGSGLPPQLSLATGFALPFHWSVAPLSAAPSVRPLQHDFRRPG